MKKTLIDNSVFIPEGPVSRMIFLPVFARALESKKKNSLLTDLKAVEISDHISDPHRFFAAPEESLLHYAIICRTLCFDRLIRDFIWRHPNGTVINIGCGLDSTFDRFNPKKIQWYDLDLPDVIELRKSFFTETENRKFIPSSFLDNEWLRKISFDESLLVFSNGVYYYYSESTIRKFFAKLSLTFPSLELVFDITSPAGVRAANRFLRKMEINGSHLIKWGVWDYRTILEWSPRLVFLGKYRLFYSNGVNLPLKYLIPGIISNALSIEQILHLRIRYNYRTI